MRERLTALDEQARALERRVRCLWAGVMLACLALVAASSQQGRPQPRGAPGSVVRAPFHVTGRHRQPLLSVEGAVTENPETAWGVVTLKNGFAPNSVSLSPFGVSCANRRGYVEADVVSQAQNDIPGSLLRLWGGEGIEIARHTPRGDVPVAQMRDGPSGTRLTMREAKGASAEVGADARGQGYLNFRAGASRRRLSPPQ